MGYGGHVLISEWADPLNSHACMYTTTKYGHTVPVTYQLQLHFICTEFTQTLQMSSVSNQTEDQRRRQNDHQLINMEPAAEEPGKARIAAADRSHWLLNLPDPPSLWTQLVSAVQHNVLPRRSKGTGTSRAVAFLRGMFPILSWARTYTISKFKKDLMAGLTLASLSIPQSIGYANLAKLDPQYGLYTSVVPPLIYALMGSSRDIAIGPVAVVSMLLSSMIPAVVDPVADPVLYTKMALTVTFFAGTFQAVLGVLRLGFLVDFLSHAAIVGFMAGAAIVIGLQQLKGLFGMTHFTARTDVVSVLGSVLGSVRHQWYPFNFALGCLFLIFLLVCRFIGKRNKKLFWVPALAPLASVVLSTLIVFLTRADKHGVKIVKHIEGGLNPSSLHKLQFKGPHLAQAAKMGLISALIALTEAIAVGRSFASMKGYHIDGNKEMVAMGFMNIIGSLTSCYIATGSFSRTAVNFSAGCETVISNIVMSLTVLVSLQLFTRLLYYTPIAILASIILSALPGLINVGEAMYIYKVDKLDFLACIGAFCGVLFVSVEIGLLIAVTISFAKIVLNAIRPSVDQIGRLPRSDTFCEMNQYPMASRSPSGILTIRLNSSYLCFANANLARGRIMRWVTEEDAELEDAAKQRLRVLILDLSNVMNIDTSGILALEELHRKLASLGIQLGIVNPRRGLMHKLKLAKFVDKIGSRWVFVSVVDAIDVCLSVKLATP